MSGFHGFRINGTYVAKPHEETEDSEDIKAAAPGIAKGFATCLEKQTPLDRHSIPSFGDSDIKRPLISADYEFGPETILLTIEDGATGDWASWEIAKAAQS